MASSNVVAAVTAHVQRLVAQGNTTPQTPQAYATACGYPGSKASALRKHIARQHKQGAQATGHGRYPAVTPKAMLGLLQGGQQASAPQATAKQRQQAQALAKRTLWARKAGASGARKATPAKATHTRTSAQPAPLPAAPTAADRTGQGS